MTLFLGLATLPFAAALAVVAARVPLVLVGLYAFLVPIGSGIGVPGLPAGFDDGSSLVGLLALGGLGLHLVFARRRASELPRALPVWLLFLGVSVLTQLWSVNPDRSATGLMALVSLVTLYVACALVAVDRRGLAFVESGIAAGGAFTGLVATYQLATSSIAVSGGDIPRFRMGVGGEGGDPNITAVVLILPLVVALGRGMRSGSRLPRTLYLVAAALAAVAIILTASRGGAIAALVAVGVLAANESRLKVIALYVALPLVIGATIFAVAPQASTSRFAKQDSTGRSEVWGLGLAACAQYCWAGSGWRTFPDVYEQEVIASASGKGNSLQLQAHNVLLAMAVEAGIVALALALLGLGLTAADLLRMPPTLRGPPLAALVGVLVGNMFVANFDYKYFWLALIYATLVVQGEWTRSHGGSSRSQGDSYAAGPHYALSVRG